MNREQRRRMQKEQHAHVAKFPEQLEPVPSDLWPSTHTAKPPFGVWRSRKYLVQAFMESAGITRLSVCRTKLNGDRWEDGITWEELQAIKAEVGYAELDAVEIYPRSGDVVNVSNMRHLWVMPGPVSFAWRKAL